MNVFDLAANISLNTDEYTSGLQNASKSTKSFGEKLGSGLKTAAGIAAGAIAAVTGAAIAGAKALWNMASATAQYGDNVDKMSQKIGLSTKAYQEWSYVMNLAGTSIDNLQMGMKTLSGVIVEAAEGSDTANEKLKAVGLTIDDLYGLSQEEQLNIVIGALQEMGSGADRTAAATQLLGRSALDMAALLNTTAKETERAKQEAHEYGMVMEEEAVKASAVFQDSLTKLGGTFTGLKNRTFGEFLPSLTMIVDGLSDLLIGKDEAIDSVSKGIENVITTIVTMTPKLISAVERIFVSVVKGIVNNAPEIIKIVVDTLITLTNELLSLMPTLVKIAGQIITSIITGITNTSPSLLATIVDVVLQIAEYILSPESLNMIFNAGMALIESLLNGILDAIPRILDVLPTILTNVVNFVFNAIPVLLKVVLNLVQKIVAMAPQIIRQIVAIIPPLINSLIKGLLENIPIIIQTGLELFSALIEARLEIIQAIIEVLPDILISIIDALIDNAPLFIDAGVQLFASIIEDVPRIVETIVKAIPKILSGVVNGFVKLYEYFKPIGESLLQGIWEGIQDASGWLQDKVGGWLNDLWGGIKDFFGIHSPSTQMEWIGEMLVDGLAGSIDKNGVDAVNAMENLNEKISGAIKDVSADVDFASDFDYGTYRQDNYVRSTSRQDNYLNRNITIVLEVDKTQLAKTIYTLNNEEIQRLGVRLANV